jgi:hypothetical protein
MRNPAEGRPHRQLWDACWNALQSPRPAFSRGVTFIWLLAGLRTLIQTRHGPDRYVPSTFLRHDALGPNPARMGEHGRTILGDVFVEQDASLSIAQETRQSCLAVEKREVALILAIMLD